MQEIDLTLCDREPIHVPGSIQPHGIMLVVDAAMNVTHAAGDVEAHLGRGDWLGSHVSDLLGSAAAAEAQGIMRGEARHALDPVTPPSARGVFDSHFYLSGKRLVIELEPRGSDARSRALLPQLEAAAAAFQRAPGLQQLFQTAAIEFRRLSGFDRVMVYRFLEDDAGVVVGEDAAPGQRSFLNHHFPATDIPKQARALYIRNLVRVIPDVTYIPAPLRPAWGEAEPLDMSDSVLRSVSPVHLQYLKNMSVAASASISIVKDGILWGLIACHHDRPRALPPDVRSACRALAGGLSRQIKAREETDAYRERVRLRTFEDDIVALLSREGSLNDAIANHVGEIMRMLGADGVAVLRGSDLVTGGRCPPDGETRKLASWAINEATDKVFATDRLGDLYRMSEDDQRVVAGVLAITISPGEPWIVLWFRAEQLEVVNWAGNPHKSVTEGPRGVLTPRASFDAWSETVRGRSRPWTIPEIEAAGRLRTAVIGVWQNRRIRDLNRQLMNTIEEKELLIRQKEFLIGEVNHRVQNSLQLVSSFLALQARASDDANLRAAIDEARRRLTAVSLVHRRLYRADQLEAIDAARYIDELLADLLVSMGEDWRAHVASDLQPVTLPTDRAVGLGLVLTELVINANKYAYGGAAGPLHVTLVEDRNQFRLIVADEGVGHLSTRKGFGSRMMDALVRQLGGTLEFEDNKPGTRATLAAPIAAPR
ncbi:MAG TPA: histidine kinase dimerization/phosphoacceptor domain -containing protein [Beijerinckiaceae bacterium]|jgi:light-regulated signal transduction histidine kinase (bacteriophytochrome)